MAVINMRCMYSRCTVFNSQFSRPTKHNDYCCKLYTSNRTHVALFQAIIIRPGDATAILVWWCCVINHLDYSHNGLLLYYTAQYIHIIVVTSQEQYLGPSHLLSGSRHIKCSYVGHPSPTICFPSLSAVR